MLSKKSVARAGYATIESRRPAIGSARDSTVARWRLGSTVAALAPKRVRAAVGVRRGFLARGERGRIGEAFFRDEPLQRREPMVIIA